MVYFNDDGTQKISTPDVWLTNRISLYNHEKRIIERKIKRINLIVDSFVENPNADNRFYYFKFIFKNRTYYKLGITSQTIKERYGSDYYKIDKMLYDKKIDGAIKIEQELKDKFKEHNFPLRFFNDAGHTEIYDKDILELDT